jgi:hypothetical protein
MVSPLAGAKALEMLVEGKSDLKQAAQDLYSGGDVSRVVHRKTLARAVREAAARQGRQLAVYHGRPVKQLTAANKQKRLQFALTNRNRDWGRVMFTDRKRFYFRYPGSKVQRSTWTDRGSKPTAFTVSNPQCVNLYAGITKAGVTKCRLVAGTSKRRSTYKTKEGKRARNITAGEYSKVLKHTLLPGGGELLGGSTRTPWVLQQDNDPTHRVASHTIATWNRAHSVRCELLDNWPPNSPDLNPIENVWGWVDAKVQALGCQNFPQFQKAVLATVKAVPQSMLDNLFASRPKRISKVIDSKGEKTGY